VLSAPPPTVLPAPPATPVAARTTAALPLHTLACVSDPAQQRVWLDTIHLMELQPGADLHSLARIRSYITEGVTFDIVDPPAVIFHDNTSTVIENADTVRTRIREYIAFEAIVPLPADHPLPFGVQPLHVILKDGKKPRLVIDLSRNLNSHLPYEYFSYSSVRTAVDLSTPDCWYSKLDLTNCFLSFPLHASALPHVIFSFEGQLYQFVRMPFGLSIAPRICTELLTVVGFRLRVEGLRRLLIYLDDFLFISQCAASSRQSLEASQRVLTEFGLVVNPAKTEGPSQRLAFLGIVLDSQAQSLSLTPARVGELSILLATTLESLTIRLSDLASLAGKLQFATSVLPGFRPFTRSLYALLAKREASIRARQTPGLSPRGWHFSLRNSSVRVDDSLRDDIRFWLFHLKEWNGSQRWRSPRDQQYTFASDASLHGFGFYLESAPPSATSARRPDDPLAPPSATSARRPDDPLAPPSATSARWPDDLLAPPSATSARWPDDVLAPPSATSARWPDNLLVGAGFLGIYSPEDAALHSCSGQMTWCELFAVYAALCTYRPVLRDCCVLFRVDNETDVHVLNNQATRSPLLSGLLREIFTIAVENNLSLFAIHRPGVDNILADYLSRPMLHRYGETVAAFASQPRDDPPGRISTSGVVLAWQRAHPSHSSLLRSVSVVHSSHFSGRLARPSGASSAASSSRPTRGGRTARTGGRSAASAASTASARPSPSTKST
jgi:hypothetical protein